MNTPAPRTAMRSENSGTSEAVRTLAVDVIAQAIRCNPRNTAAGTLAERCLRALHGANYKVVPRDVHDELVAALQSLLEMPTACATNNEVYENLIRRERARAALNLIRRERARAALSKAGEAS